VKTIPTVLVAVALVATSAIVLTAVTRDRIPPELDDFRNSAHIAFGEMTVNVDVAESESPPLPGESSVFYSLDGQASWSEVELVELTGYSGGTREASFAIADGEVRYYFVVREDSSAAFGSPENVGDIFPPPSNLTADPGTEDGGDVVDPLNNSLDLDGFRVGYSDSFLYATLSNVTGSWPTAHTIFGPWFVYSLVVDNPDAGEDSIAFALVYANVPLIAQSGLFFVDARDTTYERIADIDHEISNGDLHMRCSLEDLYSHPYFGSSNPSGYYSLGAGTATAWLANLGEKADSTCVHAYYHRTERAAAGPNTPPSLMSFGHEHTDQQGVNGAVMKLYVTYSDPDGHLPTVRNAVVDGVPVEMGAGPDHDYEEGVQFSVDVDLTLEDHLYYFSFSDGAATVETVADTIPLGSGIDPPSATGAVALNSLWPRPSSGTVLVSFELPGDDAGSLDVYDVAGRHIRRVWSGRGGRHDSAWDGRDESGKPVTSGVYFLKLSSSRGHDSAKLVMLR